jgi:hypothetical protein
MVADYEKASGDKIDNQHAPKVRHEWGRKQAWPL